MPLTDAYKLHLIAVLLFDYALSEVARYDYHRKKEDHREQHAETVTSEGRP